MANRHPQSRTRAIAGFMAAAGLILGSQVAGAATLRITENSSEGIASVEFAANDTNFVTLTANPGNNYILSNTSFQFLPLPSSFTSPDGEDTFQLDITGNGLTLLVGNSFFSLGGDTGPADFDPTFTLTGVTPTLNVVIVSPAEVPEPSTFLLLGLGLGALGLASAWHRSRRTTRE